MKEIIEHKVGKVNEGITVEATEGVTPGGARHSYRIIASSHKQLPHHVSMIFFATDKNNGLTNEVLLAIVLDRLRDFQDGPFRCLENDAAIRDIEAALCSLHHRTQDRVSRGVEGKHEA